ncbi:hypothetical protein [Xanthobacter sp.]|uniref:hypothetical protein n=1 Tax=Xanthobacter sp. TaxID=35809 RepID=UPI0025E9E9C7|nr:hypothetical protein [Xanthobacter sp.]
MKTRTLIGTALLLSTAGLGVALAATQIDHLDLPFHSRDDARPLRLADNDHRREGKERHHDDEDDDDDDDDDGGRPGPRAGVVPQNGSADPTTPVPDNGLFQGKARPKVEVQ